MSKIAVVYDRKNWCWYYQALALQKYAPSEYKVDIIPSRRFRTAVAAKYDALLCFSMTECPVFAGQLKESGRRELNIRQVTVAAHMGLTLPVGTDGTTILRNATTSAERLPMFDGVICVNRRLREFCSKYTSAVYLPAGVDLDVFHLRKRPAEQWDMRIGWCSQPAPNKGLQIVEKLRNLLPNIDWQICARTANDPLSQEEMAAWYRTLDLFLCTSSHEGTPMPPIEAAASGVQVLTTPVGDLVEFGPFIELSPWTNENGMCLTAEHARNTIKVIKASRDWYEMGLDCRREVEKRADWSELAPRWLKFVLEGV